MIYVKRSLFLLFVMANIVSMGLCFFRPDGILGFCVGIFLSIEVIMIFVFKEQMDKLIDFFDS